VVTGYDDIKQIFRDHDTFTAQNTITPITPFTDAMRAKLVDGGYTPQPVLSNNVPPGHTRIRTVVNKLFTPRRVKQLEPDIRRLTHAHMTQIRDALARDGRADLVAALTYDLPAEVLFILLGVPAADVAQVKAWAGNRLKLYYGRTTEAEQLAMADNLIAFWHYTNDLVARKAADPQDDLTSDLIRARNGDDGILTMNEVASCMITLLVAGHETTTAALSNGLQQLLTDRGRWRDDPTRIPNAVEEILRFDPSVCAWRRKVVADTAIGDVAIPAGADLLLMLNAANRDPALFDQPHHFDVERTNAREHLAFGYGIHFCVGAPLARLEGVVVLEELTQHVPDLALVEEQTYSYVPNISFRGPRQLWVREATGG
jgi:cytochrome P450